MMQPSWHLRPVRWQYLRMDLSYHRPFYPGGNIGKLSICGTVNDLSCMGAKPLYLTCAFVIEEGFPMEKLEEIAEAMEKTAKEAGVRIVSGDTKVAGKAGGRSLYHDNRYR